jgi:hypothetical protein
MADRGLTERQKQVLVQVYRSFKEDTERERQARRRRRSAKPARTLRSKPGGRVESAG